MKKILPVIIALIILAVFLSACTNVQTMNLSLSREYVAEGNISYVSDKDQSITKMIEEVTEEDKEAPLSVEDHAAIYVDPANLVKKLCPAQVLLGLRSCKSVDNGDINITIKNAGYRNITMIFYLYYEDEEMYHIYDDQPFIEKTEKTYTLDFDKIEQQYGEITKIEATPVLLEGMEALSCQNKKLPILVESGCR
jgi:hypothetical protein